jgi:hypothetical protein
MGTAHACLIHGHERALMAQLDRSCRYEPTSTRRTATHE